MSDHEAEPRVEKRSKAFVAYGIVVLVIAFVYFCTPIGSVLVLRCQVRVAERRLVKKTDHNAVALACVALINDLGTNEYRGLGGTDMSLPAAIRALNSKSVSVFTNQVKIAFGGGFHHYGLSFLDCPDEMTNGPVLEFWADGSPGQTLLTLNRPHEKLGR